MSNSRDPKRAFYYIPGTAEALLTDPTQTSLLLELPKDSLNQVLQGGSTIHPVSVNILSRFASLNKACHTLFQPELDKQGAKKLLELVLQDNHDAILKIAKSNPRLFFLKATAQDHAKGLDEGDTCRTYEDWSPYQALFTGAVDTLAAIKPDLDEYLATLPNGSGNDLAYQQEQEKFPNGFDFPTSTYDFSPLVTAISNDAQLKQNWQNPSPATLQILEQFRKYFKPGIVKSDHPFNINNFIKAHEVYNANWDPWNIDQLNFFAVFVMGYLERMLTAPYLQASCQGLKDLINNNQVNYPALKHSSEVMNYVVGKKVNVLPLDSDPACRLGLHFVVDSYFGGLAVAADRWGARALGASPSRACLENYVKQTQRNFQDLRTHRGIKRARV